MSDKIETLLRRAYLSLAAVFLLSGVVYAPEHTTDYRDEMTEVESCLTALNEYDGYRYLMRQTGSQKTIEIIRLIENSAYPDLVRAIIEVESNWRVNALSAKDAMGLMQIRLIAADEVEPGVHPDQLFEPVTNVMIGIVIFENLMDYFQRFGSAEHWALTAYNRGRKGTFNLDMYPPRTFYSNKVLNLSMET